MGLLPEVLPAFGSRRIGAQLRIIAVVDISEKEHTLRSRGLVTPEATSLIFFFGMNQFTNLLLSSARWILSQTKVLDSLFSN